MFYLIIRMPSALETAIVYFSIIILYPNFTQVTYMSSILTAALK